MAGQDQRYTSWYYERLEMRMCCTCGALVRNERIHSAWHERTNPA